MKKKFAFLLMGPHYSPEIHHTAFETEKQITCIFTVRDFEQAKQKVLELAADGFGAIELCGAFGPQTAKEYAALTGNTIAIGYVVHDPAMDGLFADFFNKFSD